MSTPTNPLLPQLRLLQLVSPTLPVGAFTYSQGLEWAIECGWVRDVKTLKSWIGNLLHTSIRHLEVPIFARLYGADGDIEALNYWTHFLIASRETQELRTEERNRGRALAALLPEIGIPVTSKELNLYKQSQLTGFVHAARYWQIPLEEAMAGYLWGWLENITLAGVKIIPLGQTAGQQIIAELTTQLPEIIGNGFQTTDEQIGASCMAQAVASSLHETQYTRIYRS